jgi:hypothetical protein
MPPSEDDDEPASECICAFQSSLKSVLASDIYMWQLAAERRLELPDDPVMLVSIQKEKPEEHRRIFDELVELRSQLGRATALLDECFKAHEHQAAKVEDCIRDALNQKRAGAILAPTEELLAPPGSRFTGVVKPQLCRNSMLYFRMRYLLEPSFRVPFRGRICEYLESYEPRQAACGYIFDTDRQLKSEPSLVWKFLLRSDEKARYRMMFSQWLSKNT